MAEAIKMVVYSYDPEMIILGGSVSISYPRFKTAMFEGIKSFAYSRTIKNLKLYATRLKYPGILGAAGLVYFKQ
jgi:glucokinase